MYIRTLSATLLLSRLMTIPLLWWYLILRISKGCQKRRGCAKKYGKLGEDWPQMLRDGFRECMRVLKPDGVLIFKWSEYDIPVADVWKALGEKPLFGHHSGKNSKTFWGCFMKLEVTE